MTITVKSTKRKSLLDAIGIFHSNSCLLELRRSVICDDLVALVRKGNLLCSVYMYYLKLCIPRTYQFVSVQDFDFIQVNVMAWRFNVNMIGDFRAGGTGSFMFKKENLEGLKEESRRQST